MDYQLTKEGLKAVKDYDKVGYDYYRARWGEDEADYVSALSEIRKVQSIKVTLVNITNYFNDNKDHYEGRLNSICLGHIKQWIKLGLISPIK